MNKILCKKTTSMVWVWILSLSLGLLVACSYKKKEPAKTVSVPIESLTPENQAFTFEDNGKVFNNSSIDVIALEAKDFPEGLLSQIRGALLKENYPQVISLLEDRFDDVSIYYRGIAYFVMMQEDKKYDSQKRLEHANEAEKILGDLASSTTSTEIRDRALLWYAVTLQAQYRDYQNLKKAVDSLSKMSQTVDSQVYNDSVYYLGNIHAKMGWYGPARSYYRKTGDINPDGGDPVYDYVDKTFYSPAQASQVGLNRLQEYMDGTHRDYIPKTY